MNKKKCRFLQIFSPPHILAPECGNLALGFFGSQILGVIFEILKPKLAYGGLES